MNSTSMRYVAKRVDAFGLNDSVTLVPGYFENTLHQLADPNVPQWGLPVMISMPPELDVRPGELIDVTFRREGATKEG